MSTEMSGEVGFFRGREHVHMAHIRGEYAELVVEASSTERLMAKRSNGPRGLKGMLGMTCGPCEYTLYTFNVQVPTPCPCPPLSYPPSLSLSLYFSLSLSLSPSLLPHSLFPHIASLSALLSIPLHLSPAFFRPTASGGRLAFGTRTLLILTASSAATSARRT